MNILVTGSEGFIGSVLVDELGLHGHTVERFDIQRSNEEDVSLYNALEDAFERNDAVCHLAGVTDVWDTDKADIFDGNIVGVRNVAVAAEQTKTPVVFTSSVTARNPTNLYAESKEIGEYILTNFTEYVGWVRLSNVVGAGTSKGQVAAMVEQAVENGVIEVWSNGNIRRSYVSVETVCERIRRFIEKESTGFLGELGSQTMTNLEMAEIIAEVCEIEVSIERVEKMPPSPEELTVESVDGRSITPAVRSLVESKQE